MKQIVASVAIAAVALTNLASAQDAKLRSGFDGAYLGVTGGYDFRASDPYVYRPVMTSYLASDLTVPVVPPSALEGGKFGATLGRNTTLGQVLIGVEGRGQYSFTRGAMALHYTQVFPPAPYQNLDVDFLAERQRDWQFDISSRFGVQFNDWLVFGKLGVGIERVRIRYNSDWSKTRWCPDYPTCSTVEGVSIASASWQQRWTGYGLIGAGIERNFGRSFARLEAELFAHEIAYYTGAANLTLGYRF